MPSLTYQDLGGSTPVSVELNPAGEFAPYSFSATFDGTSASDSFMPCAAVYSQDGKLIARMFPSEIISPGDSAEVTYAPALGGVDTGLDLEGASTYEVVSAASNNAAVVKAAAGRVVGWFCGNTATAARYVKLYDKATAPSPGSDTPAWVIAIPAVSSANATLQVPLRFATGIGVAIVTGIANNDNTAVAASDVVVSLAYL